MKKTITTLIIVAMTLTGCGNGDETATECQNPLIPIEVDLQLDKAKNEIQVSALVTHEDVPIEHANEVAFEIWEHGNEDYHFLEKATHEGEGLYSLNWQFENDGVYYVYYHVTACDMHRMEKEQVVIGEVNVDEIIATPDIERKSLMHGEEEHHHKHNH